MDRRLAGRAALGRRARRGAVLAGLCGFGVVVLPFIATPETAGRFPLSDRYVYLGVGLLALGAAAASDASVLRSSSGARAPHRGGMRVGARGHVPTFAGDIAFNVAAVEDAPKDERALGREQRVLPGATPGRGTWTT